MNPDQDPKTQTSAELRAQLEEMDDEIEKSWARVQELRKLRPALVARIIDKDRETKFLRSI